MEGSEGSVRQGQPSRSIKQRQTEDEYEQMVMEMGHLDAGAFAGHLIDNVADEVALEGLDGITIQALKLRLEVRPNFGIEGFEDIAAAVWNQIKRSKHFNFYFLPQARPDLVPYGWDQYRDERGNAFEPLHSPVDIYPYFPVEDKEKGIRGSCEHYHSRRDVSYIVRRTSYLEAIQLFGNRLVIVATQQLREKALFGTNYKKHQSLSIVQYCIMERVGRARCSGEITRGKVSLTCLKIPPKTLFYQRKTLLKEGLMMRQNASIKFANCKCPAIITVFHIPRFYKRIEAVASLNARTIFARLNNSEDKCIPVETVVSQYGKHVLRGIQAQFPTLLETAWHTRPEIEADLDPDLDPDLEQPKKKFKPKTIRVLRLKVTDLSLQSQLVRKVLEGQSGEDEGGETEGAAEAGECEEKVNLSSANSYKDIQVLRPANHYITLSETYLLFRALFRAGTAGLTLTNLAFLQLTQLEARSTGRWLLRCDACKEGVVKLYKQKAHTYTLKQFSTESIRINNSLQEKYRTAMNELAKIRERLSSRKVRRLTKDASRRTSVSLQRRDSEEEPSSTIDIRPSEFVNLGMKSVKTLVEDEESSPTKSPKKDKVKPPPKKGKKKKASATPTKKKPGESPRELSPLRASPVRLPSLCLVQVPEPVSPARRTDVVTISKREPAPAQPEPREALFQPVAVADQGEALRLAVNEAISRSEQSTFMQEGSEEEENPSEIDSRRGDTVDEEIRARMNRQRVDWNPHDDRFILIAYIASSLFIPKYNFTKIFIFNSIQIRDLLLRKTKGKSTKTSPAIRRRVHFLMNQKSYYDIYIGLMGAAVRDEFLYESNLKQHLHPPQSKIYIIPPDDALETVVNYLYEKFDSDDFVITDTRTNVNELETILFLRQLKRSEFYWNALEFALFCPMGTRTSDRYRFRAMWRNYIHIATCSNNASAEKELPAIGGIPEAETAEEQEGENEEENDSGSIALEELDEEEEKKTPEEFYTEYCFRFLKFLIKQLKIVFNNMLLLGTVRNSNDFQLIYFDPKFMSSSMGSTPNICLAGRECWSDSDIRLWGARALVIEYVFCGNSSKALDRFVLGVNRAKLPLERAAVLLTSGRVFTSSKKTGMLGLSRNNLKSFVMGLPANSYDETLDFLNYIDEASNVDSLACISVGILFGIVELSDYFKSSINVIESVFTLSDEWAPVYDGISQEEERFKSTKKGKKRKAAHGDHQHASNESCKRARYSQEEEEDMEDLFECFEDIERDMYVKKSKGNVGLEEGESYISSSTNALRLLRIRLNQAGVHMPRKQFTGFVEKDFFTINLPSLEFVFPKRSGLNHRIAGVSHPYGTDELKELRKLLVELVYHQIVTNLNTNNSQVQFIEKYVKKYGILFELISLAGNVGVSSTFLKRKFERKSLTKGLRYLLDSKLIFSVGIVQRRFVSYNNVKDWIIPIKPRADGSVVGHVIIRPWITSLGAISWSTVSRLFTSLLGQLQKPAVPFDELCESFSPTLSPVEVIVLIEALVKLKYLTVYKLHDSEATMFSGHPKTDSEIEYNADTLVDTENVYVAVSLYTTFLFAQLQQAAHKASRRQLAEENKGQDEQVRLGRATKQSKAKRPQVVTVEVS